MNLDLNQLPAEDIINGLSNNKIREILLSLGPRLKGVEQIDDVVICPTGHFLLTGHKRPREEEEAPIVEETIIEESESDSIIEGTVVEQPQVERMTALKWCIKYQNEMQNTNKWNHIKESWRQQFIIAVDYMIHNGLEGINIPDMTTHTYMNMTRDIGSWVKHQRIAYRDGSLSVHKKEVLENCGITWFIKHVHWDRMFELYKEYKQRHGCDPLTTYVCNTGENLGEWVSFQRKEYARMTLSEENTRKLDAMEFVWKPRDVAWYENYNKVATFLASNPYNVLPVRHKTGTKEEYGIDLATWLAKQKQKLMSGKLPFEHKLELSKLPETARQYLRLTDDASPVAQTV